VPGLKKPRRPENGESCSSLKREELNSRNSRRKRELIEIGITQGKNALMLLD